MDIISEVLSNPLSAIIFFICIMGSLYLIARFGRVYALSKVCFILLFIILFESLIQPFVIDYLCGNKLEIYIYQYLVINAYLMNELILCLYFLPYAYKPLMEYAELLNIVLSIIGTIIGAILISKSVKGFGKRDKPYTSQKEKKKEKD